MSKRSRLWIAATSIAFVACVAFIAYDWIEDPRVLRTNLKLQTLPSSVHSVSCKTAPITDVIVDCSFAVDPGDFPKLLTGWTFREHRTEGEHPDNVIALRKSMGFPVAVVFEADVSKDPEFSHGGHFIVYADSSRSHGHTSLYIE